MRGLAFIATGLIALLLATVWGDPSPLLIEPNYTATPIAVDQTVAAPNYPEVRRVLCYASNRAGSAVRVSPDLMISAAHVTRNDGCVIDGKPVQVIADDPDDDWSIVYLPGPGKVARVNCNGFKPGQWYYAVGYANAAAWQTIVGIYARFDGHISGMALFNGLGIPGQSGGAVFNSAREMVGIVNARAEEYGVTFSRALRDTPLCRA